MRNNWDEDDWDEDDWDEDYGRVESAPWWLNLLVLVAFAVVAVLAVMVWRP